MSIIDTIPDNVKLLFAFSWLCLIAIVITNSSKYFINLVTENLLISTIIFAVVIKFALSSSKLPEYVGARVDSLKSLQDFYNALEVAKSAKKLIIVDFYATWCGPCVAAAPKFGCLSTRTMSTLYFA